MENKAAPHEEHAFAEYIRILGKGKKGSRSLTQDEAQAAMGMILAGQVKPVQLGAFLMLLRVKEETPEEVAGFVRAAQATFPRIDGVTADLDWSSYAGKRRQLPWFVLSVLLLAQNGVRVFMHGAGGHTVGRLYTSDVLKALGLPLSASLEQAGEHLREHKFAYVDLAQLSATLQHIMNLRPLLGLRSPVHTVARLLNPLRAPCVLQGIFHPGYQAIHQGAARLLGYPRATVIRGEGGEIERNPDLACRAFTVRNGELGEEEWPAIFALRHKRPDTLDLAQLPALWRGEIEDEYAAAAVASTTALALKLLDRAATTAEAEDLAWTLWANRDRGALKAI